MKRGVAGHIAHGLRKNVDAVRQSVQRDVLLQGAACLGVGLEGEDAPGGPGPPGECQGIDAHMRADIQAHLTRPGVRFDVSPDARLVDPGKMDTVARIDSERLVVDLLKEPTGTRRPGEEGIVGRANEGHGGAVVAEALADGGCGAAEEGHRSCPSYRLAAFRLTRLQPVRYDNGLR